jgi:FtsP/CotA-like multicopper oxidase with cupredoxin domain
MNRRQSANFLTSPLSRRDVIVLGGFGVAGLAAIATGRAATAFGQDSRLQPGGTGVAEPGGPLGGTGAVLRQPSVLASRAGRLRIELTAAPARRRAGHATGRLGFNGSSPGPTLRVHPGDEVAVRLTNHLGHPTNLHTHGLRVTPQHNSDNPFVLVNPATSFDYLFRVPADHPTGTHWYHPHHHGMVADQIFGGLFGALLVVPRPGQGRDLATVEDRVLLISDITVDAHGRVPRAGGMDKMMGRQGALVLINGQHQPTIPAAPGAPQRWRIINACTSRVLAMRLQDHQLDQIALDGTFLPTPATQDRVVLAPGNRADVIVRPTKAGHYNLTAEPFSSDPVDMVTSIGDAAEQTVTLATMATAGPPATAPPLPGTLPAETPSTAPATGRRQITLQMGMGGMGGGRNMGRKDNGGMMMTFTIDGRSFDPARDDQTVKFGTTEEWTITNDSSLAHPFHLHTWPFTVLAISDPLTPLAGVPQDVVLIPPNGWVKLRIPFTTYSGRSVFHCHIADHGDGGMMATVNARR